jgi:hypothetical protein
MTAARRRAALGALVALLLAMLSPAAPTDRGTTSLRLAAVEKCAPPTGRLAPRSTEQLPAAAPLAPATTPSAVALTAPAGGAGRTSAAVVTSYTWRDAACVRGPPGD